MISQARPAGILGVLHALETQIPPSKRRILNTYKEIFIQNEFILFLDVG
jgi:hypothetical protein